MKVDWNATISITLILAVFVLGIFTAVAIIKNKVNSEPDYYSVTADCEANFELDKTLCFVKTYLLSKGNQRLMEQEKQIYPYRYECRTDNEGLCADILMHDSKYCKVSSSSYEVKYDNFRDRLAFEFKCYEPADEE